jgi:hypothetical protein
MEGMGFRTLKDFNLAMLAKQGWCILQNEESLLASCLKSRYFPRSNFLQAEIRFNPSFTWRSIYQAKVEVIDVTGLWRLGDGRKVRIWEDNWLPIQHGYKVWSPKPPNCVISRVCELIDEEHKGWKIQLLNELFFPFEVQQIMQIPILPSQQQDKFIWAVNKKCEFSVKSAYKFLKGRRELMSSNQSNIPRESGIWKKLWKVKSVPRHLHLIWRILHNRPPVKFSLFNRVINCTPLCCFCDQHTETIDHLFMKCDWSKSLWFASPLWFAGSVSGCKVLL